MDLEEIYFGQRSSINVGEFFSVIDFAIGY